MDYRVGQRPEGEKTDIRSLLGKTLLIKTFLINEEGKFGRPYATITAEVDGKTVYFFTSATAILNQLRKLNLKQNQLLRAKIGQRKNERNMLYYCLEEPD
ncbi:MAG: hypothetical protein QW544_03535 [Candidatus Caldarchaeum sp.]